MSKGTSPVTGDSFPDLSEKYADKEKNGNRTPNLELFGDMLKALDYEITDSGIEVGIFDDDQVPKADNHNKFSAASRKTGVPERRFIPGDNEVFEERIMTAVDQIVNESKVDTASELLDDNLDDLLKLFQSNTAGIVAGLSLDDILDDVVKEVLRKR